MSAGTICSRVVATAAPNETVRVAAQRMAEHEVGTLVVLGGDGGTQAVGILTDRDVVLRVVAAGLDADRVPVSQIMTTPVHSVDESTPLEHALERMATVATRRLVVTGETARPVGILSLDDALGLLTAEAGAIARLLEKQQPHFAATEPSW